jgi:hypothetical protein
MEHTDPTPRGRPDLQWRVFLGLAIVEAVAALGVLTWRAVGHHPLSAGIAFVGLAAATSAGSLSALVVGYRRVKSDAPVFGPGMLLTAVLLLVATIALVLAAGRGT